MLIEREEKVQLAAASKQGGRCALVGSSLIGELANAKQSEQQAGGPSAARPRRQLEWNIVRSRAVGYLTPPCGRAGNGFVFAFAYKQMCGEN